MKKSIKIVYLIEVLILFFIVIIGLYKKNFDINIAQLSFFGILSLISLLIFRFPRDKTYYRAGTLRMVIISLLSYLIIIYGLGLLIGFVKLPFAHTPLAIIKNIVPVILLIVFKEIIRYLICKNSSDNKWPVIIITFLYIVLGIIIEFSYSNISNLEGLFILFTVTILPLSFKEILYSYLTYNVSILPALLIRILMEVFIFIVPFYPNFDNYLSAVLGIMYPFIVYSAVSKAIIHAEKKDKVVVKTYRKLITYPIYFILLTLIVLISGVLRYQLIAIGSDSMKDVYQRGDAVLVYKYTKDNADKVNIGDILVYQYNDTVITHRVIDKYYSNGHIAFRTKGDNNKVMDDNVVLDSDVKGIVINKIKFIGFPTILLQEKLNEE